MNAAAAADSAFPWQEVMAFGLGRLRLAPDQFWAMTPREIAAAMAAIRPPRANPPERGALAKLMARFPDNDMEAKWPRK